MKVVEKTSGPQVGPLALAGVLMSGGFAIALVATLWGTFGPVPALVVGLVLSIAGTAWARSVDAETRHAAVVAQPPARFRDPEEVPE